MGHDLFVQVGIRYPTLVTIEISKELVAPTRFNLLVYLKTKSIIDLEIVKKVVCHEKSQEKIWRK
jgi:hypothetical protein